MNDQERDVSNGLLVEEMFVICMAVGGMDFLLRKERARNPAFRHEPYLKEAQQLHQDAMDLIRKSKKLIKKFLIIKIIRDEIAVKKN